MTIEEVLCNRNMRIFNLAAIFLITVGWVIRFYYFGKREEVKEVEVDAIIIEGEEPGIRAVKLAKVTVQDGFWLICYTLFIFPALIFIFIMQEFQVKGDWHGPVYRSFYFLDYYFGKGIYLLLCASLILQHRDIV